MLNLVSEMAVPTEIIKSMTFYHGTPNTFNGNKILRKGIQPPDLTLRKGNLRPVDGKVYVTPNLKYATIYTIGGSMIGRPNASKHLISKDRTSKFYGRYGYLFSFSGDSLSDIQPDEDVIGELLHCLLNNSARYADDSESMRRMMDDKTLSNNIISIAKRNIASGTIQKVKDGGYEYFARSGKVIVKHMSDVDKLKMIEYGSHVANTGPIFPEHAWKVDKTKVGQMNPDGSDVLDYAEQIK